jgi:hypothetical protein
VLCSKEALRNENGPFFLNDLTDDEKEYIKIVPGAWQGCQCSLYLWSWTVGLRQCLANSPWLSLGIWNGETQSLRVKGDSNALRK